MTQKMNQCKEFAELIFDCEADTDMKWLTMEWTANHFADCFIKQFTPKIIECYNNLEGYTEENKFEYNDLDNHAWRVDWIDERTEWPSSKNRESRAFVHTDQNRNILFVITKNWMYGIESMMLHQDQPEFHLMVYQYHTDYTGTPKKYETLDQLLKRGGSRYQDCRDSEYICGAGGMDGRSDGAMHRLPIIQMAFFDIETLECAQNEN